MSKKHKLLIPCLLLLLLCLVVFLFSKAGKKESLPNNSISEFSSGLTYLTELESKDPATVETTLKEFRRQELLEMREARLAEVESGDISIWSLFEDYMLMGDSRVMGFDFYGFLDENRVLAEKGDTILTLESHIPEIVAMNPAYLFISYGVNDVGSGMWSSPEDYTDDFAEIINSIQLQIPDVKIFVNSILLAYAPAFNTSSAWYNIPEYNTALEEMCSTLGCYYVDNSPLCQEYASLYEGDGIHVMSTFYPHWAANMIMAVYDSEIALEESE